MLEPIPFAGYMEIEEINNEPVAWRYRWKNSKGQFITGWQSCVEEPITDDDRFYFEPLYTHPAKENPDSYMFDALNNTLNLERNHNEKAYKELYDLCEKLAKENEALKAKTLTDEEIITVLADKFVKGHGRYSNTNLFYLEFARAILRKAQE